MRVRQGVSCCQGSRNRRVRSCDRPQKIGCPAVDNGRAQLDARSTSRSWPSPARPQTHVAQWALATGRDGDRRGQPCLEQRERETEKSLLLSGKLCAGPSAWPDKQVSVGYGPSSSSASGHVAREMLTPHPHLTKSVEWAAGALLLGWEKKKKASVPSSPTTVLVSNGWAHLSPS
ncbi:hypothetical protein LY78DRAFT_662763, partial [Colletotrichum sublineola]